MIKFKILLIVIILHLPSSFGWALSLNSVFTKDGVDVWAVGVIGNVIHSTNGGASWSYYSLGNITYNSVSANGLYIWIAGNGGILQVTSDDGNNWTQVTLTGGANLKSVCFINSTKGWIAGDSGIIMKSTNGGFNWVTQQSGTGAGLNSIVFSDSLNGVCVGANGTVIITTNGGSNWIMSGTPITSSLTSVDMKAGIIIACGVDRTVIKSTDNGGSWKIIDYKMESWVDINSVALIDSNTYYSCGSDGFIRKSTDGGATFIFQVNPMIADLYKLYFYDNNKGWACGRDNNVVLSTTDGGNTWQMPPNTTRTFTWVNRLSTDPFGTWGSIFSLSRQNHNEIFVCANKHIYRSLNYGQTWVSISSAMPYGNAPHCLVISPKDSSKMLVAYDTLFNTPPYYHGWIYRTSNYGATWQTTFIQDLDVDSNPMAFDPEHPDTVYLGTTDSLVFRSTDFGATWASTGPARLGKMCSIAIVKGHSNIILIGSSNDTNSATIYRSTDYGATWSGVYNSTGSNFPELPCITYSIYEPDKLYMASFFGNPHGLYVSKNDGLNWIQINTNENVWGISIAKDDPNEIFWGYGGGTTAYYTLNGGVNWTSTILPSTNNQSILCYNRKIVLSQQNHGIYQLSATYNNPIGIEQISTEVPKQFSMFQNYPNPFNPITRIKFDIPKPSFTKLIIYDILGREITTLVNQQLKSGKYEIEWDGNNYPSGVYFYKLISGEFTETKKMVLVK